MLLEWVKNAAEMGRRLKHVYVATADSRGMPHLAAARGVALLAPDCIAVEDWFCPGTVENVRLNPRVSIVVWDPETDVGHQMLGEVETIEETAVMDGFSAELEGGAQMPQAEHRLIVRVKKALIFSQAPHTDAER